MSEIALICQLVVAGVLAVSGISKLLDPGGTREAAEAFGTPERYSGTVAAVLPLVELAICAALVAAPGWRPAPAAALLLLVGFTAVVLENLRRGRHPQCHCFGRIGSSDISGRTVVRNVLLLAAATVALVRPPESWQLYGGRHSAGGLTVLVLTAAAVTAMIIFLEARAGRRSAATRSRADEESFVVQMANGTATRGRAPEFALTSLTGASVHLRDLLDGSRPLLLAFLSPGCGPCKRLRPVVQRWGHAFQDRVAVVVVTSGSTTAARASFGDSGLIVLVDEDRAVAGDYEVQRRPSAVVIGPEGDLVGPLAAGDPSIRRLVGALLDREHTQVAPAVSADSLTLAARLGPRPTVTSVAAGEEPFVVTDETTGASVSLDRVGALVWQCLDGRSTLSEIVHDLAHGYGAPHDVVAQDVLSLVRHLGRVGLLAGVEPDPELVAAHDHSHHARPQPVSV